MAAAPPSPPPTGPSPPTATKTTFPPVTDSTTEPLIVAKPSQVSQKEHEETLKELRRLKELQQARSNAQPRRAMFQGLGGDDSGGSCLCGHILCCWGSSCCKAMRNDMGAACEGLGKLMKRGDFLALVAVMIFIIAWAVFIGGMVWSNTYYSEYYCSPALISNGNTSQPVPTSNGSKINVAGYNVPIPAEDNPCMPPNKPERRHFPMKLSHWIPGIIISLAYCCMCGFTFKDVTQTDIEVAGVSKQECDCCLVCVKSLLLMCSVAWASIGLIMAILYFILMISFVDVLEEAKKHIAVPTVCVVIQCGLLVFGLIIGFLAKWRSIVGVQEEDSENHFD